MDRYLAAEVYRDACSPELSVDPALHGIDIVKSIAPWITIRDQNKIACDDVLDGPIDVDETFWPETDADIAIVLTRRELLNASSRGYVRSQTSPSDYIGVTLTWFKPRYRQVVVVNTRSIRRPEHVVAHEIGHVLGVEGTSQQGDAHCSDKKCLMYPVLPPFGRADRTFCECCSQQVHDNSLTLRKAKSGRFAVLGSKRL